MEHILDKIEGQNDGFIQRRTSSVDED